MVKRPHGVARQAPPFYGERPRNSPGKSTRVGSHSLVQGIFPTQGMNPCLPRCRQIIYCLSPQGSPFRRKHRSKSSQPWVNHQFFQIQQQEHKWPKRKKTNWDSLKLKKFCTAKIVSVKCQESAQMGENICKLHI